MGVDGMDELIQSGQQEEEKDTHPTEPNRHRRGWRQRHHFGPKTAKIASPNPS